MVRALSQHRASRGQRRRGDTRARAMAFLMVIVSLAALLNAILFWHRRQTPPATQGIWQPAIDTSPLPADDVTALAAIAGDGAIHPDRRLAAARAMVKIGTDEARMSLIRPIRFSAYPHALKMAAALAATPEGATTLLDAIQRKTLPPRLLLDADVQRAIGGAKSEELDRQMQALARTARAPDPALEETIRKLRAAFRPEQAKLATGRAVFLGNCSVCHKVGAEGANIGPAQDAVGLRGVDRLIEDIVDPSRNVDPAFRSTRLDLKDDSIVTGLVRSRSTDTIVLADATGKDLKVPVSEVAAEKLSEMSAMPMGFDQALSKEDLNHLLAYLLTLRTEAKN